MPIDFASVTKDSRLERMLDAIVDARCTWVFGKAYGGKGYAAMVWNAIFDLGSERWVVRASK